MGLFRKSKPEPKKTTTLKTITPKKRTWAERAACGHRNVDWIDTPGNGPWTVCGDCGADLRKPYTGRR